ILFCKEVLIKFHIRLDKQILCSLINDVQVASRYLMNKYKNVFLTTNYLQTIAILMKLNSQEFTEKVKRTMEFFHIFSQVEGSYVINFLYILKLLKNNYKNLNIYSIFNIQEIDEASEEIDENEFFYDSYQHVFTYLINIFSQEQSNLT